MTAKKIFGWTAVAVYGPIVLMRCFQSTPEEARARDERDRATAKAAYSRCDAEWRARGYGNNYIVNKHCRHEFDTLQLVHGLDPETMRRAVGL